MLCYWFFYLEKKNPILFLSLYSSLFIRLKLLFYYLDSHLYTTIFIGVYIPFFCHVQLTRLNPFESYSNGQWVWCCDFLFKSIFVINFLLFIWELQHNFRVLDPIFRLMCHPANPVRLIAELKEKTRKKYIEIFSFLKSFFS